MNFAWKVPKYRIVRKCPQCLEGQIISKDLKTWLRAYVQASRLHKKIKEKVGDPHLIGITHHTGKGA